MDIIVKYPFHEKEDIWEIFVDFTITLSDGSELVVPKGYLTDFMSSPVLTWSIFPPVGKHVIAVLVHDYLYDSKDSRGRKFADDEMVKLMRDKKIKKWKIFFSYRYVRLFGWLKWYDWI